jgi:hypothetical protein
MTILKKVTKGFADSPKYRDPSLPLLPSVKFLPPSLRENVTSEFGHFSAERCMSFFI